MRRTLAGPGEAKGGKIGTDPGKTLGAGTSDSGYRRAGSAAAGPASTKNDYAPKLDPGRQLGAADSANSGFRRTGMASGPGSSVDTTYNPTKQDPGKQLAAGTTDPAGYRRTGMAAGPGSSVDDYKPTLDPGRELPAAANAPPAGKRAVGPGTDQYNPDARDPGLTAPVSGESSDGPPVSPRNAKFCSECGTANTGGKFCANCGNKFS